MAKLASRYHGGTFSCSSVILAKPKATLVGIFSDHNETGTSAAAPRASGSGANVASVFRGAYCLSGLQRRFVYISRVVADACDMLGGGRVGWKGGGAKVIRCCTPGLISTLNVAQVIAVGDPNTKNSSCSIHINRNTKTPTRTRLIRFMCKIVYLSLQPQRKVRPIRLAMRPNRVA